MQFVQRCHWRMSSWCSLLLMKHQHRDELASRRCRCRYHRFPFSFSFFSCLRLHQSIHLSCQLVFHPSWRPSGLVCRLSALLVHYQTWLYVVVVTSITLRLRKKMIFISETRIENRIEKRIEIHVVLARPMRPLFPLFSRCALIG